MALPQESAWKKMALAGQMPPEEAAYQDVAQQYKTALEAPATQRRVQSQQDLIQQIQAQYQENLARRQQGVEGLESTLSDVAKPTYQEQIQPYLMVADMLTGSKFAQMSGARTPNERKLQEAKLRTLIEKERAGIGSDQLEFLQSQMKQTDPRFELTKQRFEFQKEEAAAKRTERIEKRERAKELSNVERKALESFQKGAGMAINIEKLIDDNEDVFGPVIGRAGSLWPYAVTAQKIQGDIDLVRQVIGKAIEEGVLRKEDEKKYKKILPILSDLPEVARSKIQRVGQMMKDDYARVLRNLKSSRKNVSGFPAIAAPPKKLLEAGKAEAEAAKAIQGDEEAEYRRLLERRKKRGRR